MIPKINQNSIKAEDFCKEKKRMTLKGKRTKYGLVEIREERGGYAIYINGVLKESSSDPELHIDKI